jgi:hypothetical protein
MHPHVLDSYARTQSQRREQCSCGLGEEYGPGNLRLVGASGFEPPASWSRTGKLKNLKPCRCRAYNDQALQNPALIGPHGPHDSRTHRIDIEVHRLPVVQHDFLRTILGRMGFGDRACWTAQSYGRLPDDPTPLVRKLQRPFGPSPRYHLAVNQRSTGQH